MSEKIYSLLLRLYPRFFREVYGNDAEQLFRDRLRHEQGCGRRMRLWFDLLGDLMASLPREYRAKRQEIPTLLAPIIPSSRSLAITIGALLSLAIPAAMTISNSLAESSTPRHRLVTTARWSAYRGTGGKAVYMLSVFTPDQLNGEDTRRVIEAAAANLRQHYFDSELGGKMADLLLADTDTPSDPAAFAKLLTRQLRDLSHDPNLSVDYFLEGLRERPAGFSAESQARYREAMERDNCTFEKVQILAHNIGYLKLNAFPDLAVCRETAASALAKLNGASAIVFDLRDNRGGYPNMVAFIAAYLFDHPEYLYNPKESTTERTWSQSPVRGNNLADKPVYILTSSRTFSGAEQFTYDLKALKRATIVGETTGGGAHAGSFYRLSDHFGIGITEVKAINPFSNTNWEGTGVEPDVKVSAASALGQALKMAQSKAGHTR